MLEVKKFIYSSGTNNVINFDIRLIHTFWIFCLFIFLCTNEASGQETQPKTTSNPILIVQNGFKKDGFPTPSWIEALRVLRSDSTLAHLQKTHKELTSEELLWADLIKSRSIVWVGWIDSLSIPFKMIEPPDTISVLLGNAGGEDAFTYTDSAIAFDLSKLHQIYGSALALENSNRIDRFFSHEMTHILHKAWAKKYKIEIESPLEAALWDCLVEGIGNYRSLSDKWIDEKGALTKHAKDVLKKLQPVFVERLLDLNDATEEESIQLMEGLSTGPFDQKWGALTCALWLAQEVKGNDSKFQPWIEAGPWGIIDLADKYLPTDLRARFLKIKKQE